MKLVDAFFCDDIRHEINNKVSLMGLYNDRIILHVNNLYEPPVEFPVNLSVLLRFTSEKSWKNSVQFKFEYLMDENPVVNINGEVIIDSEGFFNLAINGSGIPVKEGNLGFSIKIYDYEREYFSEVRKNAIKIILKKSM